MAKGDNMEDCEACMDELARIRRLKLQEPAYPWICPGHEPVKED